MVTTSIWRDTYYTTNKDILVYYIKQEDTVIFAGKAYKLPNSSNIKININSICKNYLGNDIRPLFDEYINSGETEAPSTMGVGIFYLYDAETDTLLETYKFLYDWSYELNWNGNNGIILSRPVNGRIDSRMFQVESRIAYDDIYNFVEGGDYTVVDSCNAEYGLYYLNAYGGWDAFLFEGKSEKKDTITQYTTDRSFNNTTLDFEAYRYVSEISTSYTLHTGWLNDEQSENFVRNLVGSNLVYLHDLKNDNIIPAIITDTNVTYQKMKNNGGKQAAYTVNIKNSQSKLRQ